MKAKKNPALNEKKLKKDFDFYIQAKNQREKFVFDYEYRNNFINKCIELGVIKEDELKLEMSKSLEASEAYVYSSTGDYTPAFGMWVWQNIWFTIAFDKNDFDYEMFKCYEALSKMKLKN